jgi:uncharacterized protein (DUF4415 family)
MPKNNAVTPNASDRLTARVQHALRAGRNMHVDADGWYVDDATGELIGPDPDMERELTDEQLAQADHYEGGKLIRRGRPPSPETRKVAIKFRLDPDLAAKLRESGPGYQTRVNEMLRMVVMSKGAATLTALLAARKAVAARKPATAVKATRKPARKAAAKRIKRTKWTERTKRPKSKSSALALLRRRKAAHRPRPQRARA